MNKDPQVGLHVATSGTAVGRRVCGLGVWKEINSERQRVLDLIGRLMNCEDVGFYQVQWLGHFDQRSDSHKGWTPSGVRENGDLLEMITATPMRDAGSLSQDRSPESCMHC